MGPKRNKKGKTKVKGRELGQRKPSRISGKTVLIVCEDEKSSPDYFERFRKKFRLSTVNVEVCGKECGSAPISVVNFAKEKKKSVETSTRLDGYDYIFCVVDVDNHLSLGDAVQTARDNNIDLIISNPCFEYWYILHFRRSSAAYHRSRDVVSDLKKDFPNYDKGNADIFEEIYPRRKTAIANSKGVLRSHWHDEADLRKCNPSTHVHQVVECIMDIAAKSRPRTRK